MFWMTFTWGISSSLSGIQTFSHPGFPRELCMDSLETFPPPGPLLSGSHCPQCVYLINSWFYSYPNLSNSVCGSNSGSNSSLLGGHLAFGVGGCISRAWLPRINCHFMSYSDSWASSRKEGQKVTFKEHCVRCFHKASSFMYQVWGVHLAQSIFQSRNNTYSTCIHWMVRLFLAPLTSPPHLFRGFTIFFRSKMPETTRVHTWFPLRGEEGHFLTFSSGLGLP